MKGSVWGCRGFTSMTYAGNDKGSSTPQRYIVTQHPQPRPDPQSYKHLQTSVSCHCLSHQPSTARLLSSKPNFRIANMSNFVYNAQLVGLRDLNYATSTDMRNRMLSPFTIFLRNRPPLLDQLLALRCPLSDMQLPEQLEPPYRNS